MAIMSSSALETFRNRGYLALPGFVDVRTVDTIREDAKAAFAIQLRRKGLLDLESPSDNEFLSAMERLFRQDMATFVNTGKQVQHLMSLHAWSTSDEVRELLREVGMGFPCISTRPVLYFNSPRLAAREEYWRVFPHQDWRSMQGSLDSMVIWMPLVDVDRQLGALEVIPGSHLQGLVAEEMVSGFGRIPPERVREEDFVPVECRKGDVLLFSSFLVHRSGTMTRDDIRWSCHFRYNNLSEKSFVDRGFPHPYLYKPTEELLTPDFPAAEQVAGALGVSKSNS